MSEKSIRTLLAEKTLKRADALKVRLADIHEEPGSNLRAEGEDLDASIAAIAAHIAEGGMLPPLEVRPRADGGVWLVDGHRRTRAYRQAVEAGTPLQDPKDGEVWLSVVMFEGSDADRVARVITSAEGRALSPIEVAEGYRRLRAFGWSNERIAKKVSKTGSHVAQLLMLANSNSDVQAKVRQGTVSASTAIKAVRQHGEKAGAFLDGELTKAKASGKAKVTDGTIAGRRASAALHDALHQTVGEYLSGKADIEALRAAHVAILQARAPISGEAA